MSGGKNKQLYGIQPQAIPNSHSYQLVTTNEITSESQRVEGLTVPQGYNTGLQGYQDTLPCSQTYGNQIAQIAIPCRGNQNNASNQTTCRLAYKGPVIANNNMGCTPATSQIPVQTQKPSYNCQTPTSCDPNSGPFLNFQPNTFIEQVHQTRHQTLRECSVSSTNFPSSSFQRNDQIHSASIGTQDSTVVNASSKTIVRHLQASINPMNKYWNCQQTQGGGQQELSTLFGVSDVRQTYQNDQAQDHKMMTRSAQSALGVNNRGRNTFQRNFPGSRFANATTTPLENSPNNVSPVQRNSPESMFLGALPYIHTQSVQNGNPPQELYQSKQSLLPNETTNHTTDRETSKQQFVVHMDSKSLNPGVVVNSTLQSESLDVLPRVASVVSLAPLNTETTIYNEQKKVDRPSSIEFAMVDLNRTNISSLALQRDDAIMDRNDQNYSQSKKQFVAKIHLSPSHDLNSAIDQIPTISCKETLSETRLENNDGLVTLKANTKNVVDIEKTFENSPTIAQIEPSSRAPERVEEVIATPTKTQIEPGLRVPERVEEVKTPVKIKIEPHQNQDQTSCDAHSKNVAITDCVESVRISSIGEVPIKVEREELCSTPFTPHNQDVVSLDETVAYSRRVVETEPWLNSCDGIPKDDEKLHLSDGQEDLSFATMKTELVSESNMVTEESEKHDIVQSQDSFDVTSVVLVKSEPPEEQPPSCLLSVAEQSAHQYSNSKTSGTTRDNTQNHYGQTSVGGTSDHDFQISTETEDTNGLESSTFTATMKTELIDTGLAVSEPILNGEGNDEEDNDQSNGMFNLLDYLPAKRLRLITNEIVNEMDVSSVDAEADIASNLDGEKAGDSSKNEMSLDSPKIEKRKLEVKLSSIYMLEIFNDFVNNFKNDNTII